MCELRIRACYDEEADGQYQRERREPTFGWTRQYEVADRVQGEEAAECPRAGTDEWTGASWQEASGCKKHPAGQRQYHCGGQARRSKGSRKHAIASTPSKPPEGLTGGQEKLEDDGARKDDDSDDGGNMAAGHDISECSWAKYGPRRVGFDSLSGGVARKLAVFEHVEPQLFIGRAEHAELPKDEASEIHRPEAAGRDYAPIVNRESLLILGASDIGRNMIAQIAGHVAGVATIIQESGAGDCQRGATDCRDRLAGSDQFFEQMLEAKARIFAFPQVAAREDQQFHILGTHIREGTARHYTKAPHRRNRVRCEADGNYGPLTRSPKFGKGVCWLPISETVEHEQVNGSQCHAIQRKRMSVRPSDAPELVAATINNAAGERSEPATSAATPSVSAPRQAA